MKLSVITAVAIRAAGPVVGSAFAESTSATQPKPTDQELSDLIAKKISDDKTLSPDGILGPLILAWHPTCVVPERQYQSSGEHRCGARPGSEEFDCGDMRNRLSDCGGLRVK